MLQEYYKLDMHLERFHPRKLFIDEKSYQICGITQSGKTKLLKSYLSSLKKRSYLYIDCKDERIDVETLNATLREFCLQNSIDTLALDNYTPDIMIPNVSQLLLISDTPYNIEHLQTLWLYPLDYEEFLAHEHKYDSSALNHYLQLGGLACMHKLTPDERTLYVQQKLKLALDEIEFELLKFIARFNATPLSAFSIYERLKQKRKISKDKTYQAYRALLAKRYLFEVGKFGHPKAVKKLYLADIYLKTALTTDKHFGRLFENLIFLELQKQDQECSYLENVDFYLPHNNEIILSKPFADERSVFKKVESLEAYLFAYNIKKITAVTMSKEATISHPFSTVEMVPFDIWALGD
ncbi:Putative helix-turn-helix containsing protein [hydrothermal vent metagenome]|uniref:Putative helix-turn-helix containsing protein n=1 Tax=hydrothermal vent metagenome TaxID=652676 RepID=A0A1W1BHI6_9ZZZZ